MATWIDRALAIDTVDASDVPTDGKFRTWKFIGATLAPDTVNDRLVITITGAAPNLDPVGTLALAPATSDEVRIGDDSPAHNPDWRTWTGETVFRPDSFDLRTLTYALFGAPATDGVGIYSHGTAPTPAAGTVTLKGATAIVTDAPLIDLAGGYTRLRRAVQASNNLASSNATGALTFATHAYVLTGAATGRTLPDITASDVGREIRINWLGTSGSLVVTPDGADTIDGAATLTLDPNTPSATFIAESTSRWTAIVHRKTGGATTSIADGSASVACAAPNVNIAAATAGTVTLATDGGDLSLDTNAALVTTGAVTVQAGAAQSITHALGAAASKRVEDVSGTSWRCRDFGTANTLGYTHTSNATATTGVAVGTLSLSCTGAITLTGSTDFNLTATAGAGFVACNGNLRNTVGGNLINNVFGRVCEWNDQAGTEQRAALRWPAGVVMASAGTPSTQLAISLATSGTDITIRGRHSVKPTAGGAAQITIFEASYENVGGTVTIVGSASIASSGATLGTFSISISGTTINLVFTPTLATSYTGKVVSLEMRY